MAESFDKATATLQWSMEVTNITLEYNYFSSLLETDYRGGGGEKERGEEGTTKQNKTVVKNLLSKSKKSVELKNIPLQAFLHAAPDKTNHTVRNTELPSVKTLYGK